MILFTDSHSAEAFHRTYCHTLEQVRNGPYPDPHIAFLDMVRVAMEADRVYYIFHGSSDTKKDGIPAYFDWVWYRRDVIDQKYGDYAHDFPTRTPPLEELRNQTRVMNGGWMNHGTAKDPQWSSHS